MPRSSPIAPLLGALTALESWLDEQGLAHVYIGGLAVALVGRPRITQDIDGIVLLGGMSIEEAFRRAGAAGFSPRAVDGAAFARKNRVILLRHQATEVAIDLSVGLLPFEEDAVRRATRIRVKGLHVPVATPEDLVVLKSIAGRPRDIADIEGLLDANPKLDRDRARASTAGFAEILEAPEILESLDRILAAHAIGSGPRENR